MNYSIKNSGLILFILLFFLDNVFGQTGKLFPSISGENSADKVVTIPEDTMGKFTLIGMAYSKKSEDDLKTWFNPIYNSFIHKSAKPSLFNEPVPDVKVYFLPMFTGVNQAAAGTAKKKMVQGIDPKLHPHVVFYKGELKRYKDELDFEKKDIPYFFVLDKQGKIVYATSGSFSNKKLDEIYDVLEED
ncbi:hypothetical protein BH23BAC1_BH23BAC1_19680 [soil metagenome]